MGTIILVRHGENDWAKKNKLAGHIPGIHLNENGHRQAHAVAQRLAALPIKAVYSSPITRCLETAAYVADTHRLAVQHVDELAEVEYGEWEGKKIKQLAKKPLWWTVQFAPSRAQFPKGETLREVQFRAVQALEALASRHQKDTIVVVSHADVIRLLLAHYLGVHIDLFQRLVISPASASVIALEPNGMVRVLRLNDDGPLHPAPSKKRAKGEEKRAKTKSAGKPDTTAAGETAQAPAGNGRDGWTELPTSKAGAAMGGNAGDGNGRPESGLTGMAVALDEEE
jgi:probable phosphoglycerate mutase